MAKPPVNLKIKPRRPITFDVFTLDPANELLMRGSERIHLRPKTYSFLHLLATHPGQMITKEKLLDALWKDCFVGDGALKNCVAELRKVLGDPAEEPRFIETAHRRGYRFIAKINLGHIKDGAQAAGFRSQDHELSDHASRLVGRTRELSQLQQLLERALRGVRQVAFVTGEQGIGKTTLVDEFLRIVTLESPVRGFPEFQRRPWIARGQCIKAHGAGEAYMPFGEALAELSYKADRKKVVAILRQYAPMWLLQMPALVNAAQMRTLRSATMGASGERMLREMAEALEAIAGENPLILVLEDLHWSDYATLDLISYWAQRRAPARVLLIGTFRSTESIGGDHPLRSIHQELQAHNLCQEMPLSFLSEDAIREFLAQRFPEHSFPGGMAEWIHRRTEGNPLFMINVLDHLIARGLIEGRDGHWILNIPLERAELEVPPTIQQIIERQLEECSRQEQRLFQAASVVGVEFSAAAVAAALGQNVDLVDSRLSECACRHFLLHSIQDHPLPERSGEGYYGFRHVLYQNICYQLLPEKLRAELHWRIAEYIEKTGKEQLGDLAARIAAHFEQGGDYSRAIHYYQKAADNANWRYAGREALDLAQRGIQLLKAAPAFPEKINSEMSLHVALGNGLIATKGIAAEEVKHTFARATELFRRLPKDRRSHNNDLLFSSLWGLWNYNWIRAEYAAARESADRLLQLAEAQRDSTKLMQAHYALGIIMMDHGEFRGALEHLEQNPTVVSRIYAALIMWNLGYPDRALRYVEETLEHALAAQIPEDCIFAYVATARVHAARREASKALDRAQASMNLARQQDFLELWLAPMKTISGWALVKIGKLTEGIGQVRQALSEYRGIGSTNFSPFLLAMFAEILADTGEVAEGLAVIHEALNASRNTGMSYHEAEIYRLKGELLLQQIHKTGTREEYNSNLHDVETCFEQAIAAARRQQAKSFELRATTSLARFLQSQNRRPEARDRLTAIYDRFIEGQETPDLVDARKLIRDLS